MLDQCALHHPSPPSGATALEHHAVQALGGKAMAHDIHVIGGGLAGSEAAWQLARRGLRVRLSEMRGGGDSTPAHQGDGLAELVIKPGWPHMVRVACISKVICLT